MDNNRNTPSNNPSSKDRNDRQNVQRDHQPERREKLWWTEEEVAERGRIKPGEPENPRRDSK